MDADPGEDGSCQDPEPSHCKSPSSRRCHRCTVHGPPDEAGPSLGRQKMASLAQKIINATPEAIKRGLCGGWTFPSLGSGEGHRCERCRGERGGQSSGNQFPVHLPFRSAIPFHAPAFPWAGLLLSWVHTKNGIRESFDADRSL